MLNTQLYFICWVNITVTSYCISFESNIRMRVSVSVDVRVCLMSLVAESVDCAGQNK